MFYSNAENKFNVLEQEDSKIAGVLMLEALILMLEALKIVLY